MMDNACLNTRLAREKASREPVNRREHRVNGYSRHSSPHDLLIYLSFFILVNSMKSYE